jgi:hypothetical protein
VTREISETELDEMMRDPRAFFSEPQDVVAHPRLSRDHKLAILRQWEQDALRLSASESEGMGGGEESMLGRVESAIQAAAGLP